MARGCGPRQGRSTRPLGTNDGLKITAVGRSPKPCRAGSNPAARAKFLDVRELPKVIPTPTLVLPAPEVIGHHACTARVLHTLRPFAVAMAGEGEFDPFKD